MTKKSVSTRKEGLWTEAAEVLPIFPTFVWKVQLRPKFHGEVNKKVLQVLERMTESMPALAHGTAWQSDQLLHKLGDFHDLVSCFNATAKTVLQFLRIGNDNFEITACWANISARGASHRVHNHPNNFLSGVYYVQTQSGADTLNFHDPRNQTGIIRPPVTELTEENTDQVVVKVRNGTLLIFPSYLQHSVDPNTSNETRISVSFNIMFSSFTESLSKPLWGVDEVSPSESR